MSIWSRWGLQTRVSLEIPWRREFDDNPEGRPTSNTSRLCRSEEYGRIAPGYGVWNDACDLIQGDIVDAEAPNEVLDVRDAFLMGLWRKESFELPFAIVDLPDVAELLECGNGFDHDRDFAWTVMDLLHHNRFCSARVDNA